ncbi:MAG: CRISPR-associated endonuclease Cas1 [ANME-2 cluster archaeon]|nr:MAG: CRISPR-associated endonuclease Cas1 [ANME-2 cluster archaeon]
MRLIIDKYGTYIHKKKNRFIILNQSQDNEFSADKVSQILIYRGAAITADAIDLAVKHDIDIVYLDKIGRPFARTYSCKFENSASVHRHQVRAYDNEKGIALMAGFIEGKIKNQSYLLKRLAKTRDDDRLRNIAEKIIYQTEKLSTGKTIDGSRNIIMGIEGEASKRYFQALTYVLPENVYCGHRIKQPPGDLFNALLSYGYGILYTEIEKACILAGLNPYMGFLHADRLGKPSMVLDLIEEFRQPVVDRSVITLVSKRSVQENNVEPVENGYYLDNFGKHKVVEAIVTQLAKVISYRNFQHSFSSLIQYQARQVVKFISGENKSYSPFIHRW